MKRTIKHTLRLVVAGLLLYFVVDALASEFFGSLQYFTYTGNLIAAVLLMLVVARRVDERHVVLTLSIATIIHVVYIVLLVGLDGVLDDVRTGGLENLVLHYLTPYYLAFDLFVFGEDERYAYRDTLTYLLVPVTYLGFVLVYGRVTSEYPYFFLNVPELGVAVLYYVVAIAGLFAALNVSLVALKRRRTRAVIVRE